MNSTFSSNILVCRLTGPELTKRKIKLQKEVFARVQQVEEVNEGYIFHFPDDDKLLLRIMDYMLTEKQCCPFFRYDLGIKANGEGVILKVSGTPEAKETLKALMGKSGK